MTFWIRKIQWPSVFVCSGIFTVVATVIHQVEAFLTVKYYQIPEYFGVSGKSLIFTFVTGVSLALVYYYIRDLLPKKFWHRVTYFADLLIGMSFIFFTLPAYLMFNFSGALLISLFISGFIIQVTASYLFVKLLK